MSAINLLQRVITSFCKEHWTDGSEDNNKDPRLVRNQKRRNCRLADNKKMYFCAKVITVSDRSLGIILMVHYRGL